MNVRPTLTHPIFGPRPTPFVKPQKQGAHPPRQNPVTATNVPRNQGGSDLAAYAFHRGWLK